MIVEFTLKQGRSTFAQRAEGKDFNDCFKVQAERTPKAACYGYKIIEK